MTKRLGKTPMRSIFGRVDVIFCETFPDRLKKCRKSLVRFEVLRAVSRGPLDILGPVFWVQWDHGVLHGTDVFRILAALNLLGGSRRSMQ